MHAHTTGAAFLRMMLQPWVHLSVTLCAEYTPTTAERAGTPRHDTPSQAASASARSGAGQYKCSSF